VDAGAEPELAVGVFDASELDGDVLDGVDCAQTIAASANPAKTIALEAL
jgi:hypothetical protein